ncbi:hypothetical protein [Methanobrevibacter sp.]|uniref:hypothetical protein n=1 Tax=Methanobrevibacter sp. TaxID=66852 RepID=UPI0025E6CCF7|nr:hypothetical protein [Methanobrevibacter sp.]MBQ2832358.1 hypothetical protein [Methanobrevibacter sp.]
MTTTNKTWHKIIKRHHDYRSKMLELNLKIEEAMKEYLETVGGNDDFTIRFEDSGVIQLDCNGDLFNLEQIGGFCDVFNLTLVINNRTIVENHLEDNTQIRTKYLFTTHNMKEKE